MTFDKFQSRAPVVRVQTETFEVPNPKGFGKPVTFSEEVVWLRESETQLQYRHGGKVLMTGPTHNDFYGYLTSIDDELIETAKAAAQEYGVSAGSSLEIVLVVRISDKPGLVPPALHAENQRQREKGHNRLWYAEIPRQWRLRNTGPEAEELPYRFLDEQPVDEAVIWSFHASDSENEASIAQFKAKYQVSKNAVKEGEA